MEAWKRSSSVTSGARTARAVGERSHPGTKRKRRFHVRIPEYHPPRNHWRKAIHAEAVKCARALGVRFAQNDRLELAVTLYIPEERLGWHDVDNRLKDIMDALQGRAGGSKALHPLEPIIPNDHQIHRVIIEKKTPPPQSLGQGHLTLRRYKAKSAS